MENLFNAAFLLYLLILMIVLMSRASEFPSKKVFLEVVFWPVIGLWSLLRPTLGDGYF